MATVLGNPCLIQYKLHFYAAVLIFGALKLQIKLESCKFNLIMT